MLRLLNYVDLIARANGEYVTIQQRIDAITEKYEKASKQQETKNLLFKSK